MATQPPGLASTVDSDPGGRWRWRVVLGDRQRCDPQRCRAVAAMSRDVPVFDHVAPWGAHAPRPWQAVLIGLCRALPRALHRLQFPMRRPIKYGAAKPLDVDLWGRKVRLLPRGNTTDVDLLFTPQFYDPDERALLSRQLSPGGVFVDIGANSGSYSLWADVCMRGRGRIIAIEPDPEMMARLRFTLASNAIECATLCEVALSDHEGDGELLINPAQRGENTLNAAHAATVGVDRQVQKVTLTTLLALLTQLDVHRVDALKIDIEGYEPPVLRHFFEHAPPSLWPRLAISEHKDSTFEAIESAFVSRGYRRVLLNKMNFAFARESA